MCETTRVANVDEAIDLATRWRNDGRYDWFRGQARAEWHPYPSLMRLQLQEPEWEVPYLARIGRLYSWLRSTPGLTGLADDPHSLMAIAQHYGIETNYLDFTTDPATAGFFACDVSAPQSEVDSCIFCLNTMHLTAAWGEIQGKWNRLDEIRVPDIELIHHRVPNLWRLEAQKGVFLFVQTDWDVHYPMDRIVFPYEGYPSFPAKRDIYPDRKSQLELLLDQFFANESAITTVHKLRKLYEDLQARGANATWHEVQAQPGLYHASVARSGRLDPHASWERVHPWLALSDEPHEQVLRREVPITIDLTLPPDALRSRFAAGARRAMERDTSLRNHHVNWAIEVSAARTHDTAASLSLGLNRLWDGLRRTPFDARAIAESLAVWLVLHTMDFHNAKTPARAQEICDRLFGETIGVECVSVDGASSRGYVSKGDLLAAMRDDLPEVLSDEARARAHDPEFLLSVIYSPCLLFDFDRLAALFATQIAPTQMARTPPHFYHPARLRVLGLP